MARMADRGTPGGKPPHAGRQTAAKAGKRRGKGGCGLTRNLPKSKKQTFTQKNQAKGLRHAVKYVNLQ